MKHEPKNCVSVRLHTESVLPEVRGWLIHVGDQCAVLCLQKFQVREPKRTPLKPGQFTRGPALFYNRWQLQHPPLPFSELPPDWQLAPPAKEMPKQVKVVAFFWEIGDE